MAQSRRARFQYRPFERIGQTRRTPVRKKENKITGTAPDFSGAVVLQRDIKDIYKFFIKGLKCRIFCVRIIIEL